MIMAFNPHLVAKATFSNDVDISGMIPLSASFTPSDNDVICARGKEVYNHEGNRRFRALVKSFLPTYSSCVTKMQKTRLVAEIIATVRNASQHGGFVKNVNGQWFEVGDRRAKEKTGQTMRDLLHTRYSSSTKAKARARQQLREDHQNRSQDNAQAIQQPEPRVLDFPPRFHEEAFEHQITSDKQTEFSFPMADQIFSLQDADPNKEKLPLDLGFQDHQIRERLDLGVPSFEDNQIQFKEPSVDLDPLPLDESIVDFDLDARLSVAAVSDDSFRAAMDFFLSSFQD